MMKRILFFLLIGSFSSFSAYAQLTTTTLTSTKDTYIDVKNSSTNYGTDSLLWVTTHLGDTSGNYVYGRSFLSFDLSSIPTNAEIYSVKLRLYRDTAYAGSNSFKASLAKQSWTESGLNASNQPVISLFYEHYSTVYADSTSFIDIDFLIPTKRLALAEVENFGICVQLTNETLQSESGSQFYSREVTNSALRPKLIIKYGTPLEIGGVEIQHESAASAGDGFIKFDISGGTTPYTYSWFSGQTDLPISGVNADSLMSRSYGWYGVTVTDANGFKLSQGFVIGIENDVVDITYDPRIEYADNVTTYSRYDNVTYDYTNISYTSSIALQAHQYYSNGHYASFVKWPLWLDSSFYITKADMFLDGWTHYCYPTVNQLNTAKFFLVTEDWNHNYVTYDHSPVVDTNVTLIMPNMPVGNDNVTKDVRAFWDIWKQDNASNYGLKYALLANSGYFLEQTYFSNSYNGDEVHLPKIDFTLDLRPRMVVSTWDSITQTGIIEVDLASISSKTSPYHYFVSQEPLPDLETVYHLLQDSVFSGELDSALFFMGGYSEVNRVYENLNMGKYYVDVYDHTGTKILSETSRLIPTMEFEVQTNLQINGALIEATGTGANGILELYAYQELNAAFEIELHQATGEQLFAWIDMDSTVVDTNNVVIGVSIIDTQLYTVKYGVVSSTYFTVTDSSIIIVDLSDSLYRIYVDDSLVLEAASQATFGYQMAVRLPNGGSANVYPEKAGGSGKKFNVVPIVSTIANCYEDDGLMTFKVANISGLGELSLTYQILNESGSTVASGSGTTNATLTVTGLSPGIYTVNWALTAGASGTGTIWFGYETVWDDVVDYSLSPNSYSLIRTLPSTTTNYSTARSENYLPPLQSGWLRFIPLTPASSASTPDVVRLTNANAYTVLPQNDEDFLVFMRFWNQKLMYYYIYNGGQPAIGIGFMPENERVTVRYNQTVGNTELIANGVTNVVNNVNPLGHTMRVATGPQNFGYLDVISSYGCYKQTIDEIGYHELKRELDGGFAHSAEGKIKFTFDEEYDTESGDYIALNIYDNSYALIEQIDPSGSALSGTSAVSYEFDDNKRILDLTGLGLSMNEHYILEVITSKQEKLYMRFIYKY